MTDYKPMPISGYTSQSDSKLTEVNKNKDLEERVLRRLDELKKHIAPPDAASTFVDARWLAIGRTKIEEAFMAINRSIFQPTRISLTEENVKSS